MLNSDPSKRLDDDNLCDELCKCTRLFNVVLEQDHLNLEKARLKSGYGDNTPKFDEEGHWIKPAEKFTDEEHQAVRDQNNKALALAINNLGILLS